MVVPPRHVACLEGPHSCLELKMLSGSNNMYPSPNQKNKNHPTNFFHMRRNYFLHYLEFLRQCNQLDLQHIVWKWPTMRRQPFSIGRRKNYFLTHISLGSVILNVDRQMKSYFKFIMGHNSKLLTWWSLSSPHLSHQTISIVIFLQLQNE